MDHRYLNLIEATGFYLEISSFLASGYFLALNEIGRFMICFAIGFILAFSVGEIIKYKVKIKKN